ncbi:MAG: mechanosensitive ion channel [Verrucomicrobiota bacterium]|nr:mechanosensitive ion channel [Verrucomicrobiota bacterium]
METNAVAQIVEPVAEGSANIIETVKTIGVEYGMKALGALAIIIIGMWVAKLLKKLVVKLMEKGNVDPSLISFVASLAHVALQAFVIIAALEKLNVKTASLIAMLGAAGLAIGLALQGSLANFAAGVLLIIFKPFKVGEFVEAGGAKGSVIEIGIFTTILNTMDNKKTIVPNAKLMSDNITNYSANNTRRVDLVAGISYGDDIDKARTAIEAVLKEVPGILETPAPDILVSEMADSSVNFAVRPWCAPEDYWGVYFGVTEGIKKRFDADGITIPFPQRDVHMYEHKGE